MHIVELSPAGVAMYILLITARSADCAWLTVPDVSREISKTLSALFPPSPGPHAICNVRCTSYVSPEKYVNLDTQGTTMRSTRLSLRLCPTTHPKQAQLSAPLEINGFTVLGASRMSGKLHAAPPASSPKSSSVSRSTCATSPPSAASPARAFADVTAAASEQSASRPRCVRLPPRPARGVRERWWWPRVQ